MFESVERPALSTFNLTLISPSEEAVKLTVVKGTRAAFSTIVSLSGVSLAIATVMPVPSLITTSAPSPGVTNADSSPAIASPAV